jgi:hypothetical protein
MTYQQVNLYQTVIEGTSPGLSASVLFRLCGLVVITLLLIWGRALWNTWAIRGELASLQEQRAEEQEKLSSLQQRSASWTEEDNKLSARVEGLTKEIIAKQKTEGFSPYLTGLARQPMPEIWLKRIVIADSGRQLVLNGSTISPEKVPELLQKLADEEVFAGREFNSFSLTLADPDSRVVDFNISTADAEAKGS